MSVISDKNIVRIYAAFWIVAYLALFFFGKPYLPDEYFRDSVLIQKLATNNLDSVGAFQIAAAIARIVPMPIINVFVAFTGCVTIWLVIRSLRTMRGMVYIVPILAPFLVLNVMAYGKEIFLIPLTWFILWAALKWLDLRKVMLAIILIYAFYAFFFRAYYLLILVAFIGSYVFYRVSAPLKACMLLTIILVLLVIPPHVFMTIQGDRDAINRQANIHVYLVHTAIYNPLPPTNAFYFLINYAYAAARLTLPFLFRFSVSDWILFYNVVFYFNMLKAAFKRHRNGPLSLLPVLFVSHVLVLFIFEPDLGSYLRHACSVMIYLLPALRLVEEQRANNKRMIVSAKSNLNTEHAV